MFSFIEHLQEIFFISSFKTHLQTHLITLNFLIVNEQLRPRSHDTSHHFNLSPCSVYTLGQVCYCYVILHRHDLRLGLFCPYTTLNAVPKILSDACLFVEHAKIRSCTKRLVREALSHSAPYRFSISSRRHQSACPCTDSESPSETTERTGGAGVEPTEQQRVYCLKESSTVCHLPLYMTLL